MASITTVRRSRFEMIKICGDDPIGKPDPPPLEETRTQLLSVVWLLSKALDDPKTRKTDTVRITEAMNRAVALYDRCRQKERRQHESNIRI